MITYSTASAKNVANATTKAKKVKPLVKPLADFGRYSVKGSKGVFYTVTFSKSGGEFTADCECDAAKKSLVCYHIIACSGLFKQDVHKRAASRPAYTVKAIGPDGQTLVSDYDDYGQATDHINALLNCGAVHFKDYRFEIYSSAAGDNTPILVKGYDPDRLNPERLAAIRSELFG